MRRTGYLEDLISAAGSVTQPMPLINLIERAKEAWSQSDDDNRDFWIALNEELGSFHAIAYGVGPIDAIPLAVWSNVLAWAIQEYKSWQPDAPDGQVKLRLLLILTGIMDEDGVLWRQMPEEIGKNALLISALSDLIKSTKYDMHPIGPAPDFDEDMLVFRTAEEEKNWAGLTHLLDHLSNPSIDPTCERAARILARYSFEALIDATHGIRQTVPAVLVAKALSNEAALDLALVTQSPHVKFFCAYGVIRQRTTYSEAVQHSLITLLEKISEDDKAWCAWMQVFNQYPSRFEALQIPLGTALAKMNETAFAAYIDTIELSIHLDSARGLVARCLSAFREKAALVKRRAMWRIAYERWAVWNFDSATSGTHLISIKRSALDFAVVGYAVECLCDAERSEMLASVHHALLVIEYKWHRDLSTFCTARRRLLSCMQPLHHAHSVAVNSGDWLVGETQVYLPYEAAKDRYSAFKYDDLGPVARLRKE